MRETGTTPERLLQASEVAEILGVPLQTLYVWRSRGTGPKACRVGRHLRYRRGAVEEWLLSRESSRAGSRD